jgi:hypothetical protein
MVAPFAALEARSGQAIMARQANGRASIAGGALVDAIINHALVEARAGQAGAIGRDTSIHVLTSAIGAGVQEATTVTPYYGTQAVTPVGQFVVASRLDDFGSGMTELRLKAAP